MIKLKNLDPELRHWIQSQSGQIMGDMFFCCRADSGVTRQYQQWLTDQKVPSDKIFTTTDGPVQAYAHAQGGRGDHIYVMPGWYNLGTGLNMSKRDTHMLGASSMPQIGLYGSPAVMYTSVTSTSLGYSVLMSAEQNSLRNLTVTAYGNHANQKSAVKLTQSNMYLKGVTMFNFGGSTTAGTANACDLWIDTSVPGGASSVLENCIIGNSGTTTRTSTSSAVLLFGTTGSTGGAQNMFFRDCLFLSRAETAGIPIVHYAATKVADRLHLYDRCLFYNFWESFGGSLNQCFDNDATASTFAAVLKDCGLVGVTAWQTVDNYCIKVISGPTQGAAGGIAVAPA